MPLTGKVEGASMDSISYTAARRNIAQVMDQVCNDNVPVVITHRGEASMVVKSFEECQAM